MRQREKKSLTCIGAQAAVVFIVYYRVKVYLYPNILQNCSNQVAAEWTIKDVLCGNSSHLVVYTEQWAGSRPPGRGEEAGGGGGGQSLLVEEEKSDGAAHLHVIPLSERQAHLKDVSDWQSNLGKLLIHC